MIRFTVAYENIVFKGQAQYLKDEYSFSIILGAM